MSKNNRLTDELSRCVNNVLLKYPLSLTENVMRKFPEILDSICTHKDIVSKLKRNNGPSMINAILNLFGLEVRYTNKPVVIDEEIFKSFIELDSEDANKKLEKMAEELQGIEKNVESKKSMLISEIKEKASEIEKHKGEFSKLKTQHELDKSAYFLSMQRLLEAIGPNPIDKYLIELTEIIEESLAQFGVHKVWDIPSDDNGKMFSIKKTSLERERVVQRPCLLEKESVVMKGLAYDKVGE